MERQETARLSKASKGFFVLCLAVAAAISWILWEYKTDSIPSAQSIAVYYPAHALRLAGPLQNKFSEQKGFGGSGGIAAVEVPLTFEQFKAKQLSVLWVEHVEGSSTIRYYGKENLDTTHLYTVAYEANVGKGSLFSAPTYTLEGGTLIVTYKKMSLWLLLGVTVTMGALLLGLYAVVFDIILKSRI